MSVGEPVSAAGQSRLAQVLDDYWLALRDGAAPDADELVAAHPEFADELRACLSGLEFLRFAGVAPGEDAVAPSAHVPTESLGDYRLIRELGRGGMGIVYEAEQISLGRPVALKVLPFAAVLDPMRLARFRHEAQAAAHLHHDHIVPVYAVGCERGVHYYAMQYITGCTLADVVRELRHPAGRQPPPCDAAAPTLLVRDAGARNESDVPVIVQRPAARETPWLNSFSTERSTRSRAYCQSVARLGVDAAEALDHAHEMGVVHRDIKPSNLMLDEHAKIWIADFGLAQCHGDSELTMTGQVLGTPAYMSPEQASGRRGAVDHRTDVYSLGITLYELLTLEHAFPGDDRKELLQRIALEEPRLPRQLNPSIPWELETIVLKAVAKDRDVRYTTARELADDLRRFLEDRPILARRPTLPERATKWARRHKTLVGAGVVLLFLALIGLSAGTVLISREQARTNVALGRATDGFRVSRTALNRFNIDLADALQFYPEFAHLRDRLLRDAVDYYQRFADQQAEDLDLHLEFITSRIGLGDAHLRLGELDKAEDAFQTAASMLEELSRDPNTNRRVRLELANSRVGLGNVFSQRGRFAQASTAYEQAVAGFQQLIDEAPQDPDWSAYRDGKARSLFNHAWLLSQRRAWEQAEALLQTAVAEYEDLTRTNDKRHVRYHGRLLKSRNLLGYILAERGDNERALALFHQAVDGYEALLADEPDNREYLEGLASSWIYLANALRVLGPTREVLALRDAVRKYEQLIEAHPGALHYQENLAIARLNLAQVLNRLEDNRQAKQLAMQALSVFQDLVRVDTDVPRYHDEEARCLLTCGVILRDLDENTDAETALRTGIDKYANLTDAFPNVPEYRHSQLTGESQMGRLLHKLERLDEAQQALAAAVSGFTTLVSERPDDPRARDELAWSLTFLGDVRRGTNQPEQAKESYREALDLRRKLSSTRSSVPVADTELPPRTSQTDSSQPSGADNPANLYNLVCLLTDCGDPELRNPQQAVQLAQQLVEQVPDNGDFWNVLGAALCRSGRYQESIEAFRRAETARGDFQHSADWFWLAMAHQQLNDAAQAAKFFERAESHMQQHAPGRPELITLRLEATRLLSAVSP